jgi:energy-coupling factor transporter ATP-binding protein EcfA2
MTALRFGRFGFTYAGASDPSLADVDLALAGGQVVEETASMSEGQTTLLRSGAGLLGEIYDGEVRGRLERLSNTRPGAFFDGYVQVTLAVETVREEIALPLYAAGLARGDREMRVAGVARELRIEHLLDRDVTALSGGEEKLVGIAAALASDSGIHVFDEPFEQLDVAHFAAVIRALKLRARAGKLVLVATGSVDTALNVCDAAVVSDGTRWRLIEAPTLADVAGLPGLGGSSLGDFLRERSASPQGVRRFRDAARKAS